MEFKNCSRCGAFFLNNNDICPNCEPRDKADMSKLNNFMVEGGHCGSLNDLSISTGISMNNLSRLIGKNEIDVKF